MHGSRTQQGQERSNAWAQRSSFVPADGPGINKDAKGQIPFDRKNPIQVITMRASHQALITHLFSITSLEMGKFCLYKNSIQVLEKQTYRFAAIG